jgi:prepilin-type N-terminal cleavage/methylation domain-containing protein
MSKSRCRKQVREQGFTLVEVLIAIAVLTIGVMGMALLGTRMMATGQQSKYMSAAATLASEKLEDLNRWDTDDPQVCVPTGNASVGSITGDVLQTTTCAGGNSASIAYYDDISLTVTNASGNCPNSSAGCFAETVSTQVGGATQYLTTYHSPDGYIDGGTLSGAAPAGRATFHRRWVVEANQPVAGTRRVTVLVTLQNGAIRSGATFQMSIVRP